MANFFDSLQDSFDMANAPRFVDFNALDEEEDRGNRSAWFDSHESFYADATILMSSPSKKMKKKKSAKVVSKAKAIPAEAQKAAPRIRSTRSRSTALQPVTSLAEDTTQKKRKRAASVRPQLQGHRDENSNKEAILKGAANNDNKENAPTVANSNICNTNVKSSPLPEAKQIDLDRIILERLEQNRRARRQASIASSAPSSESAMAPSAPLHVESESESNPSSEPVAQPLELPAVWHMDTVTAPCRPAQIVERDEKMAKKKSSSSSSTRRDAGKQVPVGRVLQQQRADRLANEMAKQRERAKSQREQHRVRAETEATKRLQEQEKEKEQMKAKDRAEQVEQLRKQREQEKQQRLREKEKREAEERQRKMSRFEEKLQHRKQLTLNEKQVLPLRVVDVK
jgi:hypothetical protein